MSDFSRLRGNERYGVCGDEVSGSGIAAGQGAGSRPVLPDGQETVLRMRRKVPARFQPRQILPELRRDHESQKRRST